jgi:hypothetical protein
MTWSRLAWLGATLLLCACNDRRLVEPTPAPETMRRLQFVQSLNRKLDLLFLIDDSESMEQQQTRLAKNLPVLLTGLTKLPTGLPDLHIAVVSSTSQPGPGVGNSGPCAPGNEPNGAFRHTFNPAGLANHPECQGLTLDGTFIKAEAGAPPNFTGRLEDVFSCIALLGQQGCGFEQQFGSIVRALDPSFADPGNAGFLRDDAYLGVVMLTNEDDCSAPVDTHVFDDTSRSSADPFGRLVSYRCTEFGIRCGGQMLPHTLPLHTTVTEDDCVSTDDGMLLKTTDFEDFLVGLKHGDRSKLLVAAISGQPTPFRVSDFESLSSPRDASDPTAPGLVPSCGDLDNGYADPGVRVDRVVHDLGGQRFDICMDDFSPALDQIATAIGAIIEQQCLPANVARDAAGRPICTVTQRTAVTGSKTTKDTAVPFCGTDTAPFPSPCWRWFDDGEHCGAGHAFSMCTDSACAPPAGNTSFSSDVSIECELAP